MEDIREVCNILNTIKIIATNKKEDFATIKQSFEGWYKHLYCYKSMPQLKNIIRILDDIQYRQIGILIKHIDIFLEKYDDSDIIYHYCSMEAFYSIMKTKSLWLSDSKYMNDKYEGSWVDIVIKEVLINLEPFYQKEFIQNYKANYEKMKNKRTYLCCFSQASDKLSQWRGYANDGQGIAIGFSKKAFYLTGNFDFELALNDVTYNKDMQKKSIKESIELFLKNKIDINNKEVAYFFKNPSFYEEVETRLIYTPENNMTEHTLNEIDKQFYELMSNNISELKYRNKDNVNIPYYIFDLVGTLKGFSSELIPKIILGPKNKQKLNKLSNFIEEQGLYNTQIIKSESSYI